MALLLFDGFETYDNETDMNLNSNYLIGTSGGIQASVGRRSGTCLKVAANSYYGNFGHPQSNSTVVAGVAIFLESSGTPTYSATYPFLGFYDLLETGVRHVGLHLTSSRLISAVHGDATVLGTSSGHSIEYNRWYYVEAKVILSNTVGQVIIKVDENTVLTTSADKDTINGSNAYVEMVKLASQYSNIDIYFDDFYVLDSAGGSPQNDFLGDVAIEVLRPNGAGSSTDFNPSTGSNYQNVDESSGPDGDTTYNSGEVGDIDTYAMEDYSGPSAATIFGVRNQITVRKDDAGAQNCALITRSGSTNYSGEDITLSDSFATYTEIYEDNPADSSAWESADVTAMQVGVEVKS